MITIVLLVLLSQDVEYFLFVDFAITRIVLHHLKVELNESMEN